MIAYKVLRRRLIDDEYQLCTVNENLKFDIRRFAVVYKEEMINYPKVHRTKLYFFDTRVNARSFLNAQFDDNLVIWKVDATDLRSAPSMTGPSNAVKYWDKVLNGITYYQSGRDLFFSDGTSMSLISHAGAMTGSHCKLLERV